MNRTRSLLLGVATSGLLVLAGHGDALSQDPTVVNARTIRVKLENSRVRVLEAVIKPNEREQLHSHPAYVVHVIAGGRIRSHGTDGKATEYELVTGDTLYREPITHWAENIGSTTIHLVVVELKEPT
jgi:quercetin dioxygenase-like cupin family protein